MVFRVKLPPYWSGDSALWFAQVEGSFFNRILLDKRQSLLTNTCLQHDVAQEVGDFIIAPPAKDRYDKLKTELVK